MAVTNRLLAQPPERGALPTLFAATAPGVEGGDYYGPDGFQEFRGAPKKVEAIPAAYDRETGSRLWQISEELTGVTTGFLRLGEPQRRSLSNQERGTDRHQAPKSP